LSAREGGRDHGSVIKDHIAEKKKGKRWGRKERNGPAKSGKERTIHDRRKKYGQRRKGEKKIVLKRGAFKVRGEGSGIGQS